MNKLGSGDLKINLNNEEITITDSNPYRGIYVNRDNLFKECSNEEPYECKLNIDVSGENIPFTLLIRDAQDNTIASYLPQNEMILGMSESFSPLYFYTDIKSGSAGDVFINYKKGVSKVFGYIKNRDKTNDKSDKANWGKYIPNSGDLTYKNNRITFTTSDTSNCENGCELYIGVYIYDNEVNDADDFSLFFKYTDSNKLPVSILPNEFVFGELTQGKTDTYNIIIQKEITNVDFILECDFCKVKINNVQYSGLDKLYKYESDSLKGKTLNIEISPDASLTYPQFYSFKLIVPNDKNIRRITSENIEYCDSTSCLFAIPIKNYESTNKVSFYVTNNNYPKTFNPTLSYKLVDYNIVESNQQVTYEVSGININNNFYTISIESRDKDKDQYLVLKLVSYSF